MSLVLNFCITCPLLVSVMLRFCGSAISSAVTMQGPIGAKVSRDFIWKNTLPGGGRPRAEPSMKQV